VPREALAEILAAAEVGGALREPPPKRVMEPSVHYVSCPQCHCSMNRMRFGKLSGVIVDVCMKHGTWFDAGELTRVIAFVAAGGLTNEHPDESARDDAWRDYLGDLSKG
jgi:Zn-finger nucleic acid-binding protein